ncbi:MAG: hypothetical protein LBV32_03765 [Tannerellaceae bacterium]|jgi:hypothetical protein|nr:hypothetical protein [Tannerellaceae bacterium]
MKHYILLFITTIIPFFNTKAQVVKINNGLSISKMKNDKLSLFEKTIDTYSLFFGIDYLSGKYYEMSSEVGYIAKGGKEQGVYINDNPNYNTWNIIAKKSYININTTFRLKFPFNNSYIYAGAGPKIDFITGNNEFKNIYLSGYKLSNTIFGLKTEIGINQILNRNFLAGISTCYWIDFNRFAYSDYTRLGNRTISIFITIGYILN